MIIKNRDLAFNMDGTPNMAMIVNVMEEHKMELHRLKKLLDYYNGKHEILRRQKSSDRCANNKAVFNHAQNITDTVVGYVHGNPISYSGGNIESLLEHFVIIDEDSHNAELGIDASIFGRAYELIYIDDELTNKPMPYLATLNPLNTFVVYDTTIKKKPIYAITYNENLDLDGNIESYNVLVYTEDTIYTYLCNTLGGVGTLIDAEIHNFNGIPIIELNNNKFEQGDFEQVIPLIDLYNILMNDRVNDKEQLVDALLVIIGLNLGDTLDEQSETTRLIRDERILSIEANGDGTATGDAKYLTKSLNETEIEVLKKAIETDIHKLTKVPNMSDENFANNVSGVAMAYKLLGFEQLGVNKERQFMKLLRKRLALISNIEGIKGNNLDLNKISIVMKRTLPVNLDDKLKELQGTEGCLSLRTRIQRYDENLDVEEELKRLDEENKRKANNMNEAFGTFNFPQKDEKIDNTEKDKE